MEPETGKKVDWMERLHGASALCALVFAGLLIGSGIGLAMAYVPSQAEAFASVLYLRQQGGVGAFLALTPLPPLVGSGGRDVSHGSLCRARRGRTASASGSTG